MLLTYILLLHISLFFRNQNLSNRYDDVQIKRPIKCICEIYTHLFYYVLIYLIVQCSFRLNIKKKLKGRLSTEKRYRISELTPETTLSLTTFLWMKLLSNDLVMSGSLVPYDVAVTISLSNPGRSVNSPIANPLDNLFKVLKKYSEQRWSYFHYFQSCL